MSEHIYFVSRAQGLDLQDLNLYSLSLCWTDGALRMEPRDLDRYDGMLEDPR